MFEVESPARRSDRKRTPTLARGSRDPLKAFAGRQDDPGDPVIRARPLRIMTVSVTALLRSRGRRRRHGVPRDVRGCPERALRSSTLDATSAYEIMVETSTRSGVLRTTVGCGGVVAIAARSDRSGKRLTAIRARLRAAAAPILVVTIANKTG